MGTLTTRLGLFKPDPDPVTGDDVDVTDLNNNADILDAAVGFFVCTSGTRPGSPWEGLAIYETDTDRVYVWDGVAWQQVATASGSLVGSLTASGTLTSSALVVDSIEIDPTGAAVGHLLRHNGAGKFASVAPEAADVYPKVSNINSALSISTSSLTYVNMTGATLTHTKVRGTATNLYIDFKSSWFASVGTGANPTWGVRVNGVDYDLATMGANNHNLRNFVGGARLITGLGAGSYSCQLRWKTNGDIINMSGDRLSLTVMETAA